jgi:enoyl-CoA hydratase/carnithine racemase
MELILTGDVITGEELQRFGLVSQSFPEPDVLPKAMSLAHRIAAHSAPVIQIARQTILNGISPSLRS